MATPPRKKKKKKVQNDNPRERHVTYGSSQVRFFLPHTQTRVSIKMFILF